MLARIVLVAAAAVLAGAAQGEPVDFNRDIRPLFVEHCLACHGGVKQAADLSFVYPEQVLPPDGWVVEPGDPDASELVARVESDDPDLRMPPAEHGRALNADEIATLRAWIEQGAEWRRHWAFEKPQPTEVPAAGASWAKNDIDRFVQERLEAEGLEPSPAAAPARWLRRVSLDLTGLPPTPAELDAFLARVERDGEAAYGAEVDRLLASPHFGERWASVWLDQVRYADSRGMGHDRPREAWKFRDWVVGALNDDLPYDRFLVMQLAGDLMSEPTADDLIATAACRMTQTNEEGGTDDEEFRVAAVLDRVNTTWQAYQGVTFGCVQCHAHPYDPFRHQDYYRFVAFFNNTTDTDLPEESPWFLTPVDPAAHDRAVELDRHISGLREAIWNHEHTTTSDLSLWHKPKDFTVESTNGTKLVIEERNGAHEYHTVGAVAKKSDITIGIDPPEGLRRITAVRVTGLPLDPDSAVDHSEWGFMWSHLTADVVREGAEEPEPVAIARLVGDEPHPIIDPQESLNEESEVGYGPNSRIHYPRTATLLLAEPVELHEGDRLRVTLVHRKYAGDSITMVTKRGRVEVSGDERLAELLTDPGLVEQREQLAELQSEREAIESVSTPVMRERPKDLARPTHVFIRGLFLDKGEEVSPGTPGSFPELKAEGEPGRLDLAEWFVADDNPLTARVAVNRFWARLFGVGLVETEEDFGSSGERPSHPELLDHLATRFQHDWGWSVKRLLREVTLSATYRQSSQVTEDLFERDPSNRLLARGPRVRLPAEGVRDAALAVSGLLDRKVGGPPVKPPLPEGVWKPFYGADKWPATEPGDASRYRRSIYTYVKRSIPYPMFAAFDSPSREFCTPRRLRSNTPLQALQMLNSEAMAECAAALAERLEGHSDRPADQAAYGYKLALSREPTERETELLTELHAELGAEGVAAALLNLDEFVTK